MMMMKKKKFPSSCFFLYSLLRLQNICFLLLTSPTRDLVLLWIEANRWIVYWWVNKFISLQFCFLSVFFLNKWCNYLNNQLWNIWFITYTPYVILHNFTSNYRWIWICIHISYVYIVVFFFKVYLTNIIWKILSWLLFINTLFYLINRICLYKRTLILFEKF